MNEREISGYNDIIETWGKNLNYIRMAINLGQISSLYMQGFVTAQKKPSKKKKLSKKKKPSKKSSKKKKSKKSPKKKKG